MSGITPHTNTGIDADENCSSVLERNSSFALSTPMRASSGVCSSMTVSTIEQASDNQELTAPSSVTSRRIAARTLFVKRTQLLIASGLIAGITPTSTRKRSAQATLDFAFSKPDGGAVDGLKADS
jgi:hypothetical protein